MEPEKILEVVKWADQYCTCESHYNYTCTKCKDTEKGWLQEHKEAIDVCIERGLVEWDSYQNLVATSIARMMLHVKPAKGLRRRK